MLIGRIQQFVDGLSQYVPLGEEDTCGLNEFKLQFSELNQDSQLNKDSEAWILFCCFSRWQKIRATPFREQLTNLANVDQIWLDLAIELIDEMPKSYLDESDKILHHVDELPDQIKPLLMTSQAITPLPIVKSTSKRALSIKELFRIRNKHDAFEVGDETYSNAWEYFCKKIAPSWECQEDNAWVLYPELLELINHYQEQGHNLLFTEKLKEFNSNIINLPLEEVNYFYSLSFNFRGEKTYLFEILVDCWAGTDFHGEKLIEIARLLHGKNPNWISTNLLVQPMYESKEIGRYFSLSKFRQLVSELSAGESHVVQDELKRFREVLFIATEITPQLIDQLGTLYQLRWSEIVDKDDFVAPLNFIHQSWLQLAQFLAGASLIDNYYSFLMPSLEQNSVWLIHEMREWPLTTFPLNFYILSDDNKQLIYLPDSVNHYRAKGTFYNCINPAKPIPLTAKEKARLFRVDPDSSNYFKRIDSKKTISKETVERVKQLVLDSLYIEGLSGELDNASTQSLNAEIAYTRYYYQYIKDLELTNPEEYANLCAHTIQFNDTCLTVKKVLDNVVRDKECVASNGKFFLKLVLDYQPDTTFVRPNVGYPDLFNDYSLDRFVEQHGLRKQSARLIYRDTVIDHEEALRCLMTLFVSLMTRHFNVVYGTGCKIEVFGLNNWTTATGKKIFDEIWSLIDGGNLKIARSIYTSIQESIIEPAINDRSYKSTLTRYPDTSGWLESIKSNDLFNAENAIYFSLEKIFHVLIVLWELEKNDSKKLLLSQCLDALLNIEQPISPGHIYSSNPYKLGLELNIQLIKLLSQPKNDMIKEEVLRALRADEGTKSLDLKEISPEVMLRFLEPKGVLKFGSFFSTSSLPCKTPQLMAKATVESDSMVAFV